MSIRRIVLAFAILVVIVGVIITGCSREPKEISIAIASSITGDLAANGKDMMNGALMAFEEVNSQGGILGSKIKAEVFDDEGIPKNAVSIANKIAANKQIVGVVGHLTSGCMSAAAPVYARNGLPVIMPVPTNPKITQQGYANLFRIPATDDDQGPFMARFVLHTQKNARVAVVSDLTTYGEGLASAFRKTLSEEGGNVVAYEGVQKEQRDFRTLIAKMRNADYVFLGATYDLGAPFAKQMRELGLNATILSGDGCYSTAFIELAGAAAEGTIVSFIAPDRSSSEATIDFFGKYEKKYGKVVSFAPLGYDAAHTLVEGIKKAGKVNRQSIIDALHGDDFTWNGITGVIQFDKQGDNKNKNLSLYVVKSGQFVLYK